MNIRHNFQPKNIIAVDVYLEKLKTRTYVGRLTHRNNIFYFEYDKNYLALDNTLPLGPDLLLTKKFYTAKKLFASLQDRIPSRENPAYSDYCKSTGISEYEKNAIVLLATIGKRGPSSFIFEPVYDDGFSAKDLQEYRKSLDLTVRDFAAVFDVSASSIHKIEHGKSTGTDVLKRVEILQKFPEVAFYEIMRHQGVLPHQKLLQLLGCNLFKAYYAHYLKGRVDAFKKIVQKTK